MHVVDETADLDDAAQMIASAKTFDCATSCLADNSVAAHSSIYETLKRKLVERGGHVCAPAERARLQAVMWPKGERIPSIEVVAKPASRIAELAGIELAPDRGFLVIEEEGVGEAHPFSGEKLSVVLALYQYQGGIDSAVDLVNRITSYQGAGHTCGIHSSRNDPRPGISLWHQDRARNGQPEHERRGRQRSQRAALYPFALLRVLGREHHDGERQCPPFRQSDLGLSPGGAAPRGARGSLRRSLVEIRQRVSVGPGQLGDAQKSRSPFVAGTRNPTQGPL